jgi:hypothetical protein
MGEQVAVPVPKPAPKAPPKSTFEGVIKGPAGPLKDWPFLLKKNGAAIDKGGLGGGSSPNAYRDGTWVTGANGEFKFEQMPEGYYTIEVLLAGGKLTLGDLEAPPPANETGHRDHTPSPLDRRSFSEDPEL